MVIKTDEDGQLLCPNCGEWAGTHIDDAYVSGRLYEDGPLINVHITDDVSMIHEEQADMPIPDPGRRHTFALVGWCECCAGRWSLEFQQHKGVTLVTVRDLGNV